MKNSALSSRFLISDELWKVIEPLIRAVKGPRKRRPHELSERMFVEAILYQARTGNPWRDTPSEFGNWLAVYRRFRRWERWGLWEQIWKHLQSLNAKPVRHLFIDSTVRASASARRWRLEEKRRPNQAGHWKIQRRMDDQTACRLRR